MNCEEPAEQLGAASKSELLSAFGTLGTVVGDRTGPNPGSQDEKEWWCLRRYFLTLDEAELLEFPIAVEKRERPDFWCTFAGCGVGIEVTEATDRRDQREMTKMAQGDTASLLGTFGGRFLGGAVGESPECAWKADVLTAVERKVKKIITYPSNKVQEYRHINICK
jgi:hypothetical protein